MCEGLCDEDMEDSFWVEAVVFQKFEGVGVVSVELSHSQALLFSRALIVFTL